MNLVISIIKLLRMDQMSRGSWAEIRVLGSWLGAEEKRGSQMPNLRILLVTNIDRSQASNCIVEMTRVDNEQVRSSTCQQLAGSSLYTLPALLPASS